MTGDILVVPACGKGRGGGHLIRSAALVESLRRSGAGAFLHVPGKAPADFPFPGFFDKGFFDKDLFIGEDEIPSRSWGLVILDLFRTEKKELARWLRLGPVAAVDEGGCRDDCDFLIDLLPSPRKKNPPNILCPAFLPLPKNTRPSFYRAGLSLRILVSFGAEDPAALTVPAALALAKAAGTACRVTALFGPLNKSPASDRLSEAGVFTARENGSGARESFSGYDLIVTHFGIGAFEALAAKVPVLLVSPGSCHEKLAKNAGFYSAGIGRKGARRTGSLLFREDPGGTLNRAFWETLGPEKTAARHGLDAPPRQTLGDLLGTFSPMVNLRCPACGRENRPAPSSAASGRGTPGAGTFPPV
jgi:spore coat polysaccharide biosynthesis predicted glycosyltransferase SpsG